ncbi:ABC transporter substrate-binding protein [Vibrio hippocampi]|uniref:Autoinducer 2-binding periplasmic protein LuxP n=1 Tax=Vibrio hippocampi TaxID=654686 RepID=A0ABN8DJ25_9VIBR|nr:ABC transporter substrate-binding protein [Vibrio hippocampi]CAH0526577.1 hypothetical protein VHP8226_01931 [Vibrio hippocampi]
MIRSALVSFVLFFISFSAHATETRVLFVNPGFANESFWSDVDRYAHAVADRLNLSLEVIHGNRDTDLMRQKLLLRINSGEQPDFVVLVNEENSGAMLLDVLGQSDAFVTFALNDLTATQRQKLREDSNWQQRLLPGVIPNNFSIGYLTAQALYQQGQKESGHFVLFSGDNSTPASIDREAGANSFISRHPDITLTQRVYAHWDQNTAYQKAKQLLKQYPDIRYIWTANDHMAFGVQQALTEANRVIGEDVFLSTVNTSQQVLTQLKQKQLSVLGGGHFIAVGLTLVKIHQYLTEDLWPPRTKFSLFELITYPSPLFNQLSQKSWDKIPFEQIDLNSRHIDAFNLSP